VVAGQCVGEGPRNAKSSGTASLIALATVLGLTTAAIDCTNPMAPNPATVEGTWLSADFTYDLRQSQDSIGGVAICVIETACGPVVDGSPVHGSVKDSAVRLSFAVPPGLATFAGAMTNDTVIVGMLTTESGASADTLRRISSSQRLGTIRAKIALHRGINVDAARNTATMIWR
jgi:hypothetical protein